MVSALDSGASVPGSSPGRGYCVVFLGKTLYTHGAFPNQVYKWVPANLMLGVTLRWIHPAGSRNISRFFMLLKPG